MPRDGERQRQALKADHPPLGTSAQTLARGQDSTPSPAGLEGSSWPLLFSEAGKGPDWQIG